MGCTDLVTHVYIHTAHTYIMDPLMIKYYSYYVVMLSGIGTYLIGATIFLTSCCCNIMI